MSENNNPPIYAATDEFLAELRELGYHGNIEVEDLIDFIEEDPSYIEQMRPIVRCIDEMNFISRAAAEWYYNRRFPT